MEKEKPIWRNRHQRHDAEAAIEKKKKERKQQRKEKNPPTRTFPYWHLMTQEARRDTWLLQTASRPLYPTRYAWIPERQFGVCGTLGT